MKELHPNDAMRIMEKCGFDGVIIYGYVRTEEDQTKVNTEYATYGKSDQYTGDSALIGKMLHSVWTCAENTKEEAIAVGKKVKEQFKRRLLAESMSEPNIIVNGVVLTDAQSMSLRVALNDFQISMASDSALGDDDTGEAIRKGYSDRLAEVAKIMLQRRRSVDLAYK